MIEIYTRKGFEDFISLREEARIFKETPNWESDDEIMRTQPFCNINRKYDTGTIKLQNALIDKSDDLKIFGIITYRMLSSGRLITDMLKESYSIEEFIYRVSNAEKYTVGRIAYQLPAYTKGITFKSFFDDYLVKNKDNIINCIKNLKNVSYNDAIAKVNEAVGFKRKLNFCIFQGILDISNNFPGTIDKTSIPHFGIGSAGCLDKISSTEKIPNDDTLKECLLPHCENDYVILEHALCEYDKYCKYSTGVKKMKPPRNK